MGGLLPGFSGGANAGIARGSDITEERQEQRAVCDVPRAMFYVPCPMDDVLRPVMVEYLLVKIEIVRTTD